MDLRDKNQTRVTFFLLYNTKGDILKTFQAALSHAIFVFTHIKIRHKKTRLGSWQV